MTIDRLEVHLDRCFCAGQAYVALSRCTTFDGLRVHSSGNVKDKIKADPRVIAFDESLTEL